MSSIKSLKGLVTFVTGGANGLGLATVQRFLRHGAKVAFCDLESSSGEDVVNSFAMHDNVPLYVPADVTSEKDIRNALSVTKTKFGKLDALIHCAGRNRAFRLYNFTTNECHHLEDYEEVNQLNVLGTINVNLLAADLMKDNEPDEDGHRGTIVNTSGASAFDGQTGQVAISSSCGAINAMTLPIARELSSVGIRCCTILPGLFQTMLVTSLPEKVIMDLVNATPFPVRLGDPDEYAHAAQFLVENPLMNGEVLKLTGGLRLDF